MRHGDDILTLKRLLAEKGANDIPVMAKIEKPQAIENLDSILDAADAIMVARGDLGVEMRAEKVPMLQKRIIRQCNYRSIPVITATQMLDSMIHNPRPHSGRSQRRGQCHHRRDGCGDAVRGICRRCLSG